MLFLSQAEKQTAINQWLSDNPLVVGLILLVIGGVIAISGLWELRHGVGHDRLGNEVEGERGKTIATIRLVGGLGVCAYGVFRMIAG